MPKKIVKKPVVSDVVKGEKDTRVSKPFTIIEGQCRIGLSKGATINIGNFQFARFDAWIERVVTDDLEVIEANLEEMSDLLEAELERQQEELESE